MEILRRSANPWGQEVLLGIGWDLLWVAVIAGVAFIAVHAVLVLRLNTRAGAGSSDSDAASGSIPAQIVRHNLPSRLFHWTMAAAMLALLATAFAPVMGFQFDWITAHWVAGLVLVGAVIFHLIHTVFFKRLMDLWVGAEDLREGTQELMHVLGRGEAPSAKQGKYPVANKLYHHGAAAATLAAVLTGLFMMVRIDTPVFAQDQYLLTDSTWGLMYVVHGLAGVGLVFMTMAHIYFAVRPEKWWQTRSMIKGWITREEYLEHHDPDRWRVAQAEPAEPIGTPPAPPTVESGV